MGVFQIKNLKNGKMFIGRSTDLQFVFNGQKVRLRSGRHMNEGLQDDFHRFGENGFSFDVLDVLKPKDEPGCDYTEDLKTLEKIWRDSFKPEELY